MGGSIVGAAAGDAVDLRFQPFAAGDQVVWTQSTASTGVMRLETSTGTILASLGRPRRFTAPLDFSAATDNQRWDVDRGPGHPRLTPAAPGTSATMIMRDGNNGDYEIYDIGGNAILAAGDLGQVGLEWQVAGVGGFSRHRHVGHDLARQQ